MTKFHVVATPHNKLLMAALYCASNAGCGLCYALMEDSLHAIQDCDRTREVWRCLVPKEMWRSFYGDQNLQCWVDKNLNGNLGQNY